MLTVIDPEEISVQGVAWVKNKIKQRCEAQNVPYSRSKWNQFWNYFQKTWIETFPPDLWNIYGVQREIVNRTNNPLERFHREVNARLNRQPSLRHFVKTIEEIARHYQILRKTTLPSIADIQDSESEDESDSDSIDDNNHEEDPQLSDEDLELLYDVCPEQEEAAINRDTVYLSLSVTMMHRHATSATRNHSEHRPLRTKVHPFCN
ncbi:hypothetical protein PC111_g13404 [Phytophthora cactorum]|nr:hypothetical protein PC111_g13404 [Phytophthora cactorum]